VLEKFQAWVEAGAGGAAGWAMEAENWEGFRVAVDEGEGRRGWVLLRASLHDPLLVLNVESDVPGGARARDTAPGCIHNGTCLASGREAQGPAVGEGMSKGLRAAASCPASSANCGSWNTWWQSSLPRAF